MKDICFGPKLVASFRETGFAIITDHELKESKMENFYHEWREFFISAAFKDSYRNRADHAGFFPIQSEKAKDSDVFDLKEFFHYYPTKIEDPTVGATRDMYERLELLASNVLVKLNEALPKDITEKLTEPLPSMIEGSEKTLLRILNYPAIEEIPSGAVRAAAHEDINLLTLLPAATEMGLEVQARDGEWIKVEADSSCIIVNVGDMLQEATDGYLKSTSHRVVNTNMNKERLSAPLFLHPRPSVVLSDRYTADSYLQERLKELGLG
jgi:isopenicillin N synthase-like dioxygenase